MLGRPSRISEITTMKTTMNPIFKAVMLFALPAGILVSCDSKKNDGGATKEKTQIKVTAEPKVVPTGMPFVEFNRQFLDLLAQKDLMQSALTNKVGKLCEHLDTKLLDQMLKLAAEGPQDGLSEDNWLLAYNQLMAIAGMRFGGDAAEAFYRLAADKNAPSVMRDYASQHYLRTESRVLTQMRSSTDKETSRVHLQQVLDKAGTMASDIKEEAGTLPGAVLMGLAALSMTYEKNSEEFTLIQKKVVQLAMPVLENKSGHGDSMVCAAMQALSRLQVDEAGPLIWEVAMDESLTTQMRLSAIGSLGPFSESVDVESLREKCKGDQKLKEALAMSVR